MSGFAKSETPPRVRSAGAAAPAIPGCHDKAIDSMKYQLSQRYRYVVRAARSVLGARRSAALKGRARFRASRPVPDVGAGASVGMSALVASELPHQDAVRARPVQRSAALKAHATCRSVGRALDSGAGASEERGWG